MMITNPQTNAICSLTHQNPSTTISTNPKPSCIPQPAVFYVPRNSRQILDFQNVHTPESKTKRALLSNEPFQNAIALVGMGGIGKTTILRALGRHAHIWTKFPDAVYFIHLGPDATLRTSLDQLQELVAEAFPDFLPKFIRLAAKENMHSNMINALIDRLITNRVLLIFDDVCDLDDSVFALVDAVCTAVQHVHHASCKVLTSTRNKQIGSVPMHDVSIVLSPEHSRLKTCVEILCCYAAIDRSTLSSFSPRTRQALDGIIDLCAGLPLALSVAGCAIQDVFDARADVCAQNALVQYCDSLKANITQLAIAESGDRHKGLYTALHSSLQMLENKWTCENITVGAMFRSLCILQKQMCLPLNAIEKLWGVPASDVLDGVKMLSRNSIVSLVRDEGKPILGIRVHDLVHDLSLTMAENAEGVRSWHSKLLDSFRMTISTSTNKKIGNSNDPEETVCDWWHLDKSEEYMNDNLVRHLLDAGRITEVLRLLTDYRWVEKTNEQKDRLPFQKIIAELQLLRAYLMKNEKTEMERKLMCDIDVLVKTMELCLVPHCMKNRDECTFQLYGRLYGVDCSVNLVQRLVASIEQYGRRPWARAAPGVLTSGQALLKRVLPLNDCARCFSVGAGGDDVVVAENSGKVLVVNGRDGSMKNLLIDVEAHGFVDVFVCQSSGIIISCSESGCVIIWKDSKKLRCFKAEDLEEGEWITSMQVLPNLQIVVLGTDQGRLLVLDIKNGNKIKTVVAHTQYVNSIAVDSAENTLLSSSDDGAIRLWNTETFEERRDVVDDCNLWVYGAVLSGDGRLLAYKSETNVVLRELRKGGQVWQSSEEHRNIVTCVLFSIDGKLMYSGDADGTICIWSVRNGARDVSLVHSLHHETLHYVESLSMGDNSELFVLSLDRVYVWDASESARIGEKNDVLLPQVQRFGISQDEATMVTWSPSADMNTVEIRNVCDVSSWTNRVTSSFQIPHYHLGVQFTVSNDKRTVAYSNYGTCDVFIVDAQNGSVLHRVTGIATSFTDQRDILSSDEGVHEGDATNNRAIKSLHFNSDGSILSVVAIATGVENNSIAVTKRFSWNMLSGELLEELLSTCQGEGSNHTDPVLFCKASLGIGHFSVSQNVTYKHAGKSFTIATIEHDIGCAQYCFNSSRLWVSRESGGLEYVDLISQNSQIKPREEQLLPVLSHYTAPQARSTTNDTHVFTEEVYDVFISHAGTDKCTIAEPLYQLLIALGLKVFLDKAELRPGQKASEKIVHAMKTAKIAVVILSPQFAARTWPMKELLCFLARFNDSADRDFIIIPVFYRLTLDECKDRKRLVGLVDEHGQNVFVAEGFLERVGNEGEHSIDDIMEALSMLTRITGIENKGGVTNGDCVLERAKREVFVERITDAIVEAMGRMEGNNLLDH